MRSAIGSRDIFTGMAVVLSVAALATNGSPNWSTKHAEARPSLLTQTSDGGQDAQVKKKRSFDRVTANGLKVSDATVDTLKANKVSVSEFVVSDQDGRARAAINVDGGNVLRFRAGPNETDERFVLSVFPDGRAALLMKDDRGRNRVAIAIAEDGRPFINLSDDPSIVFDDSHSRNRLVMQLEQHGQPVIRLDEHKVATLPISDSIPVIPREQ